MSSDTVPKVTAGRLSRDAYLYIRQPALYQAASNTESTARQYDLRGRALTLGWPAGRIHVIGTGQGHSGASAVGREGFRHLVAEVSLGRAGIVLGLECSRLARDSAGWQQLIKICAHNDTLICDEDGLYDPASFNDRLLLGLKGTMAESELHFLRARMQGGLLAKARRGELKRRLPAGLACDAAGTIMPGPGTEVRGALQLLLDTFTATGPARAVVAAFNAAHLTFPGRHQGGPHAGELYFKPLTHDIVLDVLHNPAYAGAYVYGRSKTSTGLDGHAHSHLRPVTGWTVCIRDHHPGYLTWAQYERNQAVLTANAASRGEDRTAGPAREGCALLQGVAICGRCGRRMTVGYHTLADRTRVPAYHCQRAGIQNARPACQAITGTAVDAAVSALICDALTPLAVASALAVTAELAADPHDPLRVVVGDDDQELTAAPAPGLLIDADPAQPAEAVLPGYGVRGDPGGDVRQRVPGDPQLRRRPRPGHVRGLPRRELLKRPGEPVITPRPRHHRGDLPVLAADDPRQPRLQERPLAVHIQRPPPHHVVLHGLAAFPALRAPPPHLLIRLGHDDQHLLRRPVLPGPPLDIRPHHDRMLGIKHFIPYRPGHLAPCQPRSITIGDEKLPGYEPPALDRHAAETRNNHKPEVSGEPRPHPVRRQRLRQHGHAGGHLHRHPRLSHPGRPVPCRHRPERAGDDTRWAHSVCRQRQQQHGRGDLTKGIAAPGAN